jgi:hypothetical protein
MGSISWMAQRQEFMMNKLMTFAAAILLSTAAVASTFPFSPGIYASDPRDCHNQGPPYGKLISADAMWESELYCPAKEWSRKAEGYRAICALDNAPHTVTFTLKQETDGSLRYIEGDWTITLHRCR